MEPCCYGFTMIPVFLKFVELTSLNFTCLFSHGELFLHVCDSFLDSVVPVITFFFHFSTVEFIPRIWSSAEFVIDIFSSVLFE